MTKSKPKNKKASSFSPYTSNKERTTRKKYLTERINSLYDAIAEWLNETEYDIKRNTIDVDEVKLPAAEIFSGSKFIASLKPVGLWAFGVNCRIDINSAKEHHILFDVADESAPPDWQLISTAPKNTTKKLTKMIFRNLLKRNNIGLRLVQTKK